MQLLFEWFVGVILSRMEFKKKAVCLILATLGIISATFSICHPLFLGTQGQSTSLAAVQEQTPLIPMDPLDATDSDAACHVRHHSVATIDGQSNTQRARSQQDAPAIKVSFFDTINNEVRISLEPSLSRLLVEPPNIQERLAFLGIYLS